MADVTPDVVGGCRWARALPPARSAALARAQLARCLALERAYGHQLNAGGRRLLRRATFAVFADLVDLGLDAEARRMVRS